MAAAHQSLDALLADVYAAATSAEGEADVAHRRFRALVAALKEHHYWPALQVKRFFDRSGLVLLHNTYARDDVQAFQSLYDACRSVVLDLSVDAPGASVVVALAGGVPSRLSDMQYQTAAASGAVDMEGGAVEESYEGSVVSVYHHGGRWHFGTSTCPSIDHSRFSHPTKSHGEMLDEALAALTLAPVDEAGETDEAVDETDETGEPVETETVEPVATPRAAFAAQLDPGSAYAFVLVHHENQRLARNEELGFGYAKLVHISTRERATGRAVELADKPLAALGVLYAQRFESAADGLAWLRAQPTARHGLILRPSADGAPATLRVAREDVLEAEALDLGSSNPWLNMLHVYMQDKPHYRVTDYMQRFLPELQSELAPPYVLHTVLTVMRNTLLDMYRASTRYFKDHKRFRMDTQLDATFAPILRFHLAQLRRIQVTTHTDAPVNARTVYHYLCHHQTLKNVRALVQHFAESAHAYGIAGNAATCFTFLHAALTDK